MTVTRESRRMSRVTPPEQDRDNGRDVRRESRDPYPTPPYPTHLFMPLVGLFINQFQRKPHLGGIAAIGIGADE